MRDQSIKHYQERKECLLSGKAFLNRGQVDFIKETICFFCGQKKREMFGVFVGKDSGSEILAPPVFINYIFFVMSHLT